MGNNYQPAGFSVNKLSQSPEIWNQEATRLSVSPVIPGTGNVTHNVTRILGISEQTPEKESTDDRTHESPVMPYSTAHFMSFRHRTLLEYSKSRDAGKIFKYHKWYKL